MKTTLSATEAAEILIADTCARWSRAGAFALVEFLEALEEDTGEEIEFDRVAIRCDFSEYASLQGWAEDYFSGNWKVEIGIAPDCIEEGISDIALDQIIRIFIMEKRGETLIEFNGGVIVSRF